MRRSINSPKRYSRRDASQAGVALLEAAIAVTTFAVLVSGLITIILQFRFESLAYEALRQSTLEMIQWRPPQNVRSPSLIAGIQCQQFGEIILTKLKNAGLDPESVSIELRSDSPNPQVARVLQQIRVNSENQRIAAFFSAQPVVIDYLPTPGVGIVHCRQRGSSTIYVGHEN